MIEHNDEREWETRVYGYARVSTEDQNLDMQIRALNDYGCTYVFKEKRSAYGVKRKQLEWLKKSLQPGDTIVVWKLDRLGRDVGELISFMAMLKKKEVNFVSLNDQIDTRTAMGNFMFHLLASLAQLERDLTAERTRAGMDAARKRGWKPGPPTLLDTIDKNELKRLRKDLCDPKMSWRKLKDKYGYAVATLRRHFEEERKEALAKLATKDEQDMERSRFPHYRLETKVSGIEVLRQDPLKSRLDEISTTEFISLETPEGETITDLNEALLRFQGVTFGN